jgi:hypothetical protein
MAHSQASFRADGINNTSINCPGPNFSRTRLDLEKRPKIINFKDLIS